MAAVIAAEVDAVIEEDCVLDVNCMLEDDGMVREGCILGEDVMLRDDCMPVGLCVLKEDDIKEETSIAFIVEENMAGSRQGVEVAAGLEDAGKGVKIMVVEGAEIALGLGPGSAPQFPRKHISLIHKAFAARKSVSGPPR